MRRVLLSGAGRPAHYAVSVLNPHSRILRISGWMSACLNALLLLLSLAGGVAVRRSSAVWVQEGKFHKSRARVT
ncbi:hypothetical protein CALCODRAFT_206976 [Calocera cornea HHB12733]|uniref:Uncharacterized protein n=1 Tax=Calocera cornea HHB12733 TaxID=1353952 RepID=A0A165K234_9BASI|nr:hypothetical protein CALCODRAFT_206976 [Calocera cornea HHB12733]